MKTFFATTASTAIILLSSVTAFAHAEFVSSLPAPDAVLTQMPGTVTVTFDDDLNPKYTKIQVFDSANNEVDLSNVTIDNTKDTAEVVLQPSLPAGQYLVKWQALCDACSMSHMTHGQFSFTVTTPN